MKELVAIALLKSATNGVSCLAKMMRAVDKM